MILQAFVRGALVIAIAALIATLLRHRSAAIRHHVWATAVVVQLALLAFIPVLPKIHLPVIPTIQAEIAPPAPTIESTNTAAVSSTVNDAAPETGNVGEPLDSSGFPLPRNPMAWITLIWLTGGALILARYVVGTLMMMRIALRGERVEDGEWLVLALRTARELGITRPITMIWGDKVAVPITWGVLYPMILLPKNAHEWSQERRRFVLVHEMAHVKRFDAFTQLLAQITTAVFWFSPFVWLAEWRMRVEREHACDDTVLRHGTEPAKYADELLQMVRTLVRRRTPQPAFAALAMARKSEFEGRMLAILDPERPRRVTGITSGIVFAMLSVLIAAPLAAVDPFAVRVVTTPTMESPRVPVASATPVFSAPDCDFASSGGATTAEVHENGLHVRLKRGARCSFVDVSGPVRISPDERRILAVDQGGMVRVRESTPGRNMQLVIERTSAAGVKRAFTINGRVPDDDGRTEREWLARVLPELLTEGSINPQQRVLRMLKSNGLAGTLRQIAAIASPTARALHFKELVAIDDWSPAELDRIKTAAVESLKSSPSDLASFNRAVPARARANSAQTNPASLTDVELIDKILGGITSGHDLSVAMLAQVPNANGEVLVVFARHAERMSSDYDKRTFLTAAGPQYFSKDRLVVGSWFNTAGTIGSSYERRLALNWAIPHANGPEVTLALIRATRTMSSGSDKAAVLAAMAKAKLLTTTELRTAFLNEVNTLSSSYDRRTVLESL